MSRRTVGCSRSCLLPSSDNLEDKSPSAWASLSGEVYRAGAVTLRDRLTARKTFDTSGKSPADYHHRENHAGPGGEIRRGLFCLENSNRTAAACYDASS